MHVHARLQTYFAVHTAITVCTFFSFFFFLRFPRSRIAQLLKCLFDFFPPLPIVGAFLPAGAVAQLLKCLSEFFFFSSFLL